MAKLAISVILENARIGFVGKIKRAIYEGILHMILWFLKLIFLTYRNDYVAMK